MTRSCVEGCPEAACVVIIVTPRVFVILSLFLSLFEGSYIV